MKKYAVISMPVLVLIGVVLPLFINMGHAHASFAPNDVMDSGVFDDTSTMNAAQIDGWLNANFPNGCISPSHGFSAPDPNGYSPSGGFTYGVNVSAGTVMYDAAQAYGINPQVLIATLQKEQSLISGGGGCSPLAYTGAMGYGCPDSGTTHDYSGVNLYTLNGATVTSVSGTCVNTAAKAGFSQQVIHAAWLLKFGEQRSRGNTSWAVIKGNWNNSDDPPTCYGGPMTQGYRKRCSNDTSAVYYDGYTTIDGVSTHIDTGPTAALYWYTPHFHGNQTFVSTFEGWFGSTRPIGLNGNPGSVSWGSGRVDNFSRGSDNSLWQQTYDASQGGWQPLVQLSGAIYSSPTVTTWGSGRMDLFAVDANGGLQHIWYGSGAWQAWESLGKPPGGVSLVSAPGAVSWGSGRIDIFARGSDGVLWQKWYDTTAGGWQPWVRFSGVLNSGPTVSSWTAGRLDLFSTGPAGDLQHYWFGTSGWGNWESLGRPGE